MRPPTNRRDFLKLSGTAALLPGRVGSAEPIMDRSQQTVSTQTTAPDWQQVTKLAANDGDDSDWFGDSVGLDGDTALIGARSDEEPNGSLAGSAYVYRRSNGSWSEEAKLTANDGDGFDLFGYSVGLDGDTALIGALDDEDPNGDSAGSAYVFEGGGGTNQSLSAKFTYSPRNPAAGNQVTFDASESSDPDGSIAAYEWDVSDDGSIDMTGQEVTYTFTDAGTYEIRLQVSDGEDTTATTTQSVTVEEREGGDAPVARFTYSPETPETGDEVTFDASDSNDPNGSIRAYEWDVTGEGEFEKTGTQITHTFSMPGEHVVSLRITDSSGATATTTRSVSVSYGVASIIPLMAPNPGDELHVIGLVVSKPSRGSSTTARLYLNDQ